jgi:nucleoside-diphosphate-sugar epimerase
MPTLICKVDAAKREQPVVVWGMEIPRREFLYVDNVRRPVCS